MILPGEIDGGLNLVNHPFVFHLERLWIRLGKIGFLEPTSTQAHADAAGNTPLSIRTGQGEGGGRGEA